ncbi:flagellar hook-associated protein FlgK [Paenibacillus sp. LjRoot56]|uniref:flagellar hook-associated protein FlgK n=1 Tax=Paenibacillus sp. LjRoot56 TaxID=3342333 RepID=UPI003ECF8756
MRSTFSGIEISKRALFSQQVALQTTGHNIANANTIGYTRQTVNLVASDPYTAAGMNRDAVPGQIGQGVEFDSINRIRESFLDQQFRHENKDLGSWNVRKDILEKLEAITNEPSDTGNRQVIENFWKSWQVVSMEPENTTARAALKEDSLAMTESLNHTATQLSQLRNDIGENLRMKANEVNSTLSQVARLNNEIFRVEGLGNKANDLRDQRDVLVDNLSKIINVTVEDSSGGYNVKMGSTSLVTGISVDTTFDSGEAGSSGITFESAVQSGDLNSGEVYGMIYSRDNYLTSYEFQLNAMVKSLMEGEVEITMPAGSVLPRNLPEGTVMNGKTYTASEVLPDSARVLTSDQKMTVKGLNGIHQLGYTLSDPPKSGVPFFTLKDGATVATAGNITINPDILANIGNIATSSRVLTDSSNNIVKNANGNEILVKGNNAISLITAGLRDKKFDFDPSSTGIPILKNGTFDEFFRAIVGQLGVQTQEADRQSTNSSALVEQVDSRRQGVSGVSLDEEMSNMIKFQHAYSAAARIMTTYDEMLDKIINGMGTVGR